MQRRTIALGATKATYRAFPQKELRETDPSLGNVKELMRQELLTQMVCRLRAVYAKTFKAESLCHAKIRRALTILTDCMRNDVILKAGGRPRSRLALSYQWGAGESQVLLLDLVFVPL